MTKHEKNLLAAEFDQLKHEIKQLEKLMAATLADLNTAITNLPAAVVAALPPQSAPQDFTPQIAALESAPAAVAALLTPPATPAS